MPKHTTETRAIIFDVDGVLIDATEWHFDSLNLALAQVGVNIRHEVHTRELLGLPTASKLRWLVERGSLPPGTEALVLESKRRHFSNIVRQRCRPVEQRIQLLSSLRSSNYRLAAVSNAVRASVIEMFELAGLTRYFDVLLCGDDVSLPKPDPEMYNLVLRQLQTNRENARAVEDGCLGIRAAKSAGIPVVKLRAFSDLNEQTLFNPLYVS